MNAPGTWRAAWGMARAHRGTFILTLGLYVIFFTAALAPGLIIRDIFDTLSGHARAGANVWTFVALLTALEGSRFGVLYLAGWTFNVFRYRAEALLKTNVMSWLMVSPGSRRLPGSAGEAVSRFRGDVIEVVGLGSVMLVSPQVITGAGALALMFAINAPMAAAVNALLILMVALTYLVSQGLRRYREASREASSRVTGLMGEIFGAVQAVKLARAEGRLVARLDSLNEQRGAASIRDAVFGGALASLNASIIALGTGLVLLLAARGLREGTFTVGDFVLFAAYLSPAAAVPVYVGQVIAMHRRSAVSIERLAALMPGAPAATLSQRPSRPIPLRTHPAHDPLRTLLVRGLTCRHPESGRGVEAVDLVLERGSFTVITGRMASGKTTLVRALLGLTPLQSGEVQWNGEVIGELSTFMTPPHCAYVAQEPRLFSDSLRENILMGATATPGALTAALRMAVFEDDVARFQSGLDTRVGVRGVTLSGGQVQRAAVARMLVRAPDLLVFDDVSSALDADTERGLWTRLRTGGERTCLAVSHRHAALRSADQIILLDKGHVSARGDLATLLRDSPLFRSIWTAGG